MTIKDSSAQTLTCLAVIILVIGLMIPSPAGRLFSAIVAGFVIAPPLCFGTPRRRISAGIVALVAALLAYAVFDQYQQDAEQYRKRTKRSTAEPSNPPTPQQIITKVQ